MWIGCWLRPSRSSWNRKMCLSVQQGDVLCNVLCAERKPTDSWWSSDLGLRQHQALPAVVKWAALRIRDCCSNMRSMQVRLSIYICWESRQCKSAVKQCVLVPAPADVLSLQSAAPSLTVHCSGAAAVAGAYAAGRQTSAGLLVQ